jgi:integrase
LIYIRRTETAEPALSNKFRGNPAAAPHNTKPALLHLADAALYCLDLRARELDTVFMSSTEQTAKVRKLTTRPALQATRILGQLRERLRYLHYSLRTEQSYVYWVRFFVHFHGLRHPREMAQPEIESFLTMLVTTRHVSASTHRQALSALLFLYKEVLDVQLPWLAEIGRPIPKKRIPSVLTLTEVERVLGFLEGEVGLLARLLYGTGMRLMEGLSLRVKDVDFARNVIVVRQGKGGTGVERRHHLFEERLSRALKRAVALAGIDKHVSVHTLRHSFATHVLKIASGGTRSPLDTLVGLAAPSTASSNLP